MLKTISNYIVSNFGFNDTTDFSGSLLHKNAMLLTIPLAGLSSLAESLFGLQSLTILAFVVLVTLELITGLVASKVSGIPIVSKKFGRFGLKVFVWVSLLFVLNSMTLEYLSHEDILGGMAGGLFGWLHSTLFIYINLEYLISVIENVGTISGKDYSAMVKSIKDRIKMVLGWKK